MEAFYPLLPHPLCHTRPCNVPWEAPYISALLQVREGIHTSALRSPKDILGALPIPAVLANTIAPALYSEKLLRIPVLGLAIHSLPLQTYLTWSLP